MTHFLIKRVAIASALSAAMLAALLPKPASAVSFDASITGPKAGSTVIDFDSPLSTGSFNSLNFGNNVQANRVVGAAAIRPANNPPNQVLRVGNGNSNGGRVDFVFDKSQRFLGFDWRNPNGSETVAFFNDTGLLLDSFSASSLSINSRRYVGFISDNSADAWTKVSFFDLSQGSPNFNIDNLGYNEVPTPALLPGLIGIGAAALRKRRQGEGADTAA